VAAPTNEDGSYRPFNAEEVAAFGLKWRGVRDGSTPTMSFEVNANRGEATCFVNWGTWPDAVLYFVGAAKTYDDGGTTRISRLLPYRFPGREGLVCTKVTRLTGFDFLGTVDDDDFPLYKYAEIGLLFEAVPYQIEADGDIASEMDRYVEIGPSEISIETIQTYGGSYKFARDPAGDDPAALPNGIPIPTNTVNKMVATEAFEVTWHRVPATAVEEASAWFARIEGDGTQGNVPLAGAINSEEIFGRPVGTVLLAGARRVRDKSPVGDGSFEYRVVLTFKGRPSGWNWLWFASTFFPSVNDFYMVSSSGTFNSADTVPDFDSLYNARDLTTAFAP
jgi:hypothetical protein